jgi:hypothetical protein
MSLKGEQAAAISGDKVLEATDLPPVVVAKGMRSPMLAMFIELPEHMGGGQQTGQRMSIARCSGVSAPGALTSSQSLRGDSVDGDAGIGLGASATDHGLDGVHPG